MSSVKEMKPAEIVVESLINAGVKMVFGIPGAKIDALFNELLDHSEIKLIVCRHEQNAAFIAAAIGRLTGSPGVCIGKFVSSVAFSHPVHNRSFVPVRHRICLY